MTGHPPLHHDDIAVDTDLARHLVDGQFPHWSHLPLRRVASSGTVNAIFRLGDDLVIRLPRAESHVWDLDTLGATEQWLRWAVGRLPLATPEPVAIGEATELYPWPWPVHRWIEGTALDTIDLTSSTRAAERLAEFVVAFRDLPDPTGPRSYKAVSRARWAPIFERVLDDLDGIIDTRRAQRAWDRTMEAASWSGTFGWVHADLLPGNLLARDGDLAAVVDFECVGTGDPALDVAAAWANFDQPTRQVFRDKVGADDDTWLRSANYALRAVMGVRYYERTNPRFSALAVRTVREVINDLSPGHSSHDPQTADRHAASTRPIGPTRHVAVRPATIDDVGFLVDVVINATRAQGRWPTELDESTFRAEYTSRSNQEVRGSVAGSTTNVIEVNGDPIGRLRIVRRPDEIELAGIQLLPTAQNQGVGAALIEDLQAEATESDIPIELGVEHDNPDARRLYERLGFREIDHGPAEVRMRWLPPR